MKNLKALVYPTALVFSLLASCASTGVRSEAPVETPASVAAVDIRGPRDLPYYDVRWAKALTLASMNTSVVSRDRFNGGEIVEVHYDAFDQPIAATDGIKTVRWRQRAWLVLPETLQHGSKAIAINIHNDHAGDKNSPRSFLGRGVGVARAFGVPVLIHGWIPDVVSSVDGRGFHDSQELAMERLLAARIEQADALPMDGRYLFNGNPLAKADMVSMTLLQRLVQKERGNTITEIGSMGISKEGASHWILGAIDDRITVLGAGGYYAHDARETYNRYGKDNGWRFPWQGGERPEYDGLRKLFTAFWKFLDWTSSTEAGRLVARTTTDPVNWYAQIKARHVLVFGDLGLMPGQHDGPWPFWSENAPLSTFRHPSWRYVRAFDGSGVMLDEQGVGEMGLGLMPQLADVLVNGTNLPGTPNVSVRKFAERQVSISARANVTPGLPHEALLLYAISRERGLRDRNSWNNAAMMETSPGRWSLDLPPIPAGHGLTFMVVVREKAVAGDLRYWRSASSMPMEEFAVPQYDLQGPKWNMQ